MGQETDSTKPVMMSMGSSRFRNGKLENFDHQGKPVETTQDQRDIAEYVMGTLAKL